MHPNENKYDQMFRDRLRDLTHPVRNDLWSRIQSGIRFRNPSVPNSGTKPLPPNSAGTPSIPPTELPLLSSAVPTASSSPSPAGGGTRWKGMMNIGMRPTVDGRERTIEVNIFDFNEDLYGRELRVFIHKYLRGEEKFNGLDALKAQLALDKENALK